MRAGSGARVVINAKAASKRILRDVESVRGRRFSMKNVNPRQLWYDQSTSPWLEEQREYIYAIA